MAQLPQGTQKLSLRSNNIRAEGLNSILAQIQANKQFLGLDTLNLADTHLKDSGARVLLLQITPNLKTLRVLNVQKNEITDRSSELLRSLQSLLSLKELYLGWVKKK